MPPPHRGLTTAKRYAIWLIIAALVVFLLGLLGTWLLMEVVNLPDGVLHLLAYFSGGFPLIPGILLFGAAATWLIDEIRLKRWP